VLNRQGDITAVNCAWVDFGHENGSGSKSTIGAGANYLETCRLAADDDPDAQRALAGIRSILDGSQTTFTPDPIAVTTGRCRIELCPSSAPV
jgi:hypothetical protein